jgi:hypothetical protein
MPRGRFRDAHLAAIAAHQHGLVTRQQLRRLGISTAKVESLLRSGRLLECDGADVLQHPAYDIGFDDLLRAAWLTLRPNHFPEERTTLNDTPLEILSGSYALAIRNISAASPNVIFAAAVDTETAASTGDVAFRDISPGDWSEIHDVPVAFPTQAVADLVLAMEDEDLVRSCLQDVIQQSDFDPATFVTLTGPAAERWGHRAGDGRSLLERFLPVLSGTTHTAAGAQRKIVFEDASLEIHTSVPVPPVGRPDRHRGKHRADPTVDPGRNSESLDHQAITAMHDALAHEREVVMVGDLHNDRTWVMNAFSRISTSGATASTILQLGDVEIGNDKAGKAFLNFIDERCAGTGIDRVLVTLGNHDNWDRVEARSDWQKGLPVRLSRTVWALPLGYVLIIGGRRVMSFGGAASLQDDLIVGKNYWPQEVPDDARYRAAAKYGRVDVLTTHEAINGGPSNVEDIITGKANQRWKPARRAASARSRALITALSKDVEADVIFHGHMHVYGETNPAATPRVIALASNGRPGNIGVLTLSSLEFRRI